MSRIVVSVLLSSLFICACDESTIALESDEIAADIEVVAADNDKFVLSMEFEHFEPEADEGALADSEPIEEQVEADRAGNCATLFEHVGYKGSALGINKGSSKWIGGPWNDHVSSIKVRPGCVFNAYEHKGHGGSHKGFSGDVPNVGGSWNDKISSYTCTC